MSVRFIICGNAETLCLGILYDTSEDAAVEAVDDAVRLLTDAGVDPGEIEVDSFFPAWNGGRHDQLRQRYGYVSLRKDASASDAELAWQANTAMDSALCSAANDEDADAVSWLRECYESRHDDREAWIDAYRRCEELGVSDDQIKAFDPDSEYRV